MNIRLNQAESYWLQQVTERLAEMTDGPLTSRLAMKFERMPALVGLTCDQRSAIQDIAKFRLDTPDCILESERSIITSILGKL